MTLSRRGGSPVRRQASPRPTLRAKTGAAAVAPRPARPPKRLRRRWEAHSTGSRARALSSKAPVGALVGLRVLGFAHVGAQPRASTATSYPRVASSRTVTRPTPTETGRRRKPGVPTDKQAESGKTRRNRRREEGRGEGRVRSRCSALGDRVGAGEPAVSGRARGGGPVVWLQQCGLRPCLVERLVAYRARFVRQVSSFPPALSFASWVCVFSRVGELVAGRPIGRW